MSSRVCWWPSSERMGVKVGWTIIWMDLTLGIQVTSGGLIVAGKRKIEKRKEKKSWSQPVAPEAALGQGK